MSCRVVVSCTCVLRNVRTRPCPRRRKASTAAIGCSSEEDTRSWIHPPLRTPAKRVSEVSGDIVDIVIGVRKKIVLIRHNEMCVRWVETERYRGCKRGWL